MKFENSLHIIVEEYLFCKIALRPLFLCNWLKTTYNYGVRYTCKDKKTFFLRFCFKDRFIYFVTNVSTYNKYIFEYIKLIFTWINSDKQSSYYTAHLPEVQEKVVLRWLYSTHDWIIWNKSSGDISWKTTFTCTWTKN